MKHTAFHTHKQHLSTAICWALRHSAFTSVDLWVGLLLRLKLHTHWLTDWSHAHFLVTGYLRCAGGKPKTVFFKQTVSLWNTSWKHQGCSGSNELLRSDVTATSCCLLQMMKDETLHGLNISVTEWLVFMSGKQCIIKVPVLVRK